MRERNRSPPSVALLVFAGVFFADFIFLLANLGFFYLFREPSKREGVRVLERESLG